MSSNRNDDAGFANKSQGSSLARAILLRVLVYGGIFGLIVALLLPSVRSARPAAQRNACLNNLKQIALALENYRAEHGALPPAYTVDDQSNRLHSWRTLILPYMEHGQLFESVDLSKPWDDPANAAARDTRVNSYECPSVERFEQQENQTTYLAVVGPDYAFVGDEPRKHSDFTDDPGSTILVVDAPAKHAVHWMSPHDISVEAILSWDADTEMNHTGILQAAFLDGHGEAIDVNVERDQLRAMLTIAGGEPSVD